MSYSFLNTAQLDQNELSYILNTAITGKSDNWLSKKDLLTRKIVGLIFMNPSLRTRASLQAGIILLGGQAVVINTGTESWKMEFKRGVVMNGDSPEHLIEAAGVLSSYFDIVGVRAFPQMQSWEEDKNDSFMTELSKELTVPLINLESSLWHPCQGLADALTITEKFKENFYKKKYVVSWTPHPKPLPMAVPNTALITGAQLGMNVVLACPKGYELSSEVIKLATDTAIKNGGSFTISNNQEDAFDGADIIHAKSWTPPEFVGRFEIEKEVRSKLGSWMITNKKMGKTNNAGFMHCLPIRRNVEATDEVIDSKNSLVNEQANNRLHAQNGLLCFMKEKGEY